MSASFVASVFTAVIFFFASLLPGAYRRFIRGLFGGSAGDGPALFGAFFWKSAATGAVTSILAGG